MMVLKVTLTPEEVEQAIIDYCNGIDAFKDVDVAPEHITFIGADGGKIKVEIEVESN